MDEAHLSPRPASPTPPTFIPFLEGLRGFAALYVVCHHAWNEPTYFGFHELSRTVYDASKIFFFGQHAVDLFIVLSGFCLMLPLTRHRTLRGGRLEFLRRRAVRILPAYYATLMILLLVLALVPAMSEPSADLWDLAIKRLDPVLVGTHFFLIHNLSLGWAHGIDPPLWSVATEWQIYFVFLLLSVPLYCRCGIWVSAGATFGVGLLLTWLIHSISQACPWFLSLFALGMLGAEISTASTRSAEWIRRRVDFRSTSSVLLMLYFACICLEQKLLAPATWEIDLIVGVIVAVVLIDSTLRWNSGWLAKAASTRPALWLGRCSYSLYLTHLPLLAAGHRVLRHYGFSVLSRLELMLLVMVPLVVLFAAGFSRIFEQPFLPRRSARTQALPLENPAVG